jgi:S-adenosylmethionine hydrolase
MVYPSPSLERHSHAAGKLITNVQPTDVEALGITRFNSFLCNVKPAASKDATEVRVLYGTDYEDVIRGGWVGFVSADGYLVIARNMESAARTIGAAAGDDVTIVTAPAEPDVP